MNKHVFGRKLSRSRPAREALFSSLIRALILSGKIETTRAKAKAIQGQAEKMVTLAKKGSINARRKVLAELDNDRKVCDLLFQKVAPAFTSRSSGFTRIIHLSVRRGDAAQMVRMEWTEKVDMAPKKEVKPEKKAKAVKSVKEVKKLTKGKGKA